MHGDVRWDLVAQGLGCHADHVDKIEDLEPAVHEARSYQGPSLVCIETSHEANLAVPEDMVARFFEVYSGPSPVAADAGTVG